MQYGRENVFFHVCRDDDEHEQTQNADGFDELSTATKHGKFTRPSVTTEGIATYSNRHGPETTHGSQLTQADERFDRKRSFVIDDDAECAPEVFLATKMLRGGRSIQGIAVREHGTDKFVKILRFIFVLPEELNKQLNKWVLVPRPCVCN